MLGITWKKWWELGTVTVIDCWVFLSWAGTLSTKGLERPRAGWVEKVRLGRIESAAA